jgi:hypothetical protein
LTHAGGVKQHRKTEVFVDESTKMATVLGGWRRRGPVAIGLVDIALSCKAASHPEQQLAIEQRGRERTKESMPGRAGLQLSLYPADAKRRGSPASLTNRFLLPDTKTFNDFAVVVGVLTAQII